MLSSTSCGRCSAMAAVSTGRPARSRSARRSTERSSSARAPPPAGNPPLIRMDASAKRLRCARLIPSGVSCFPGLKQSSIQAASSATALLWRSTPRSSTSHGQQLSSQPPEASIDWPMVSSTEWRWRYLSAGGASSRAPPASTSSFSSRRGVPRLAGAADASSPTSPCSSDRLMCNRPKRRQSTPHSTAWHDTSGCASIHSRAGHARSATGSLPGLSTLCAQRMARKLARATPLIPSPSPSSSSARDCSMQCRQRWQSHSSGELAGGSCAAAMMPSLPSATIPCHDSLASARCPFVAANPVTRRQATRHPRP
mmetsp:Transcript_45513/g.113866  ORF Transcript_45513/g.113866 Transcript_45513/m.113866 type:complete len:312 (-) Transcript_45513:350-1285(-)